MVRRQVPPGRTSISWMVVVKPFGPHHCATCSGFVQASNTSVRGASKRRVSTTSRPAVERASSLLAFTGTILLLLGELTQVRVEAVEALLPEAPVEGRPVGDVLEGRRLQPARTPLRLAAAGDQSGALEHLQVLRDRRHAHVERLGELGDGRLARREPRENGAARRVRERRKRRAELIECHGSPPRNRDWAARIGPPRTNATDKHG